MHVSDTKKVFGYLAILVLLAQACYRPPEFPVEPEVSFNNIIFKELENQQDSLILSINFRDGDGDLGLDPSETSEPYNDVWFFDTDPSEGIRPLSYSQRNTPPWDTLPPYEFPFTCINYSTDHEFPGYESDTLYYQANENHFNIIVDFFVRKNGVYTEFDWETDLDQCNDSFDGRFPILAEISSDNPLEGILRYGMTSAGFKILFRNDTLKLRIKIKDRALNDSNVLETPDFVLKDITVDPDE